MKNLSTILALFALLVSCKSSQKQAVQRLESAKVRITSIGRGQNRKTCESTDITLLREIRKELGNIRPYVQKREDGDAPTKVNYGFYEVELFSADLKVTSFLIVYTGFDGVIIFLDNRNYKNDDLERIVSAFSKDCDGVEQRRGSVK